MTRTRKRFIAGARCPRCQALDTLMLFIEHNVEQLACVACGHHESHAEASIQQASRQQEQVIGVFKPQ